jgi:hypothetical protein
MREGRRRRVRPRCRVCAPWIGRTPLEDSRDRCRFIRKEAEVSSSTESTEDAEKKELWLIAANADSRLANEQESWPA